MSYMPILKCQQLEIDELRLKLKKKSKEVDKGMELQSRLIQLVQEIVFDILNKGRLWRKEKQASWQSEWLLRENKKDKKLLMGKLAHLEDNGEFLLNFIIRLI